MATATTVTTPTLGQTGSVFTLTTLAFILLSSLQLRQTLILGHKTIEQVADTGLLRVLGFRVTGQFRHTTALVGLITQRLCRRPNRT